MTKGLTRHHTKDVDPDPAETRVAGLASTLSAAAGASRPYGGAADFLANIRPWQEGMG